MSDPDEMRKKWAAMTGSAKVSPEALKEVRALYGLDPGIRAADLFGAPPAPPTHVPTGHTLH
jgi:hypothetical protein